MLKKAIELLEVEIQRLESLIEKLHEQKFYERRDYCICEARHSQGILNLLLVESDKELDHEK